MAAQKHIIMGGKMVVRKRMIRMKNGGAQAHNMGEKSMRKRKKIMQI